MTAHMSWQIYSPTTREYCCQSWQRLHNVVQCCCYIYPALLLQFILLFTSIFTAAPRVPPSGQPANFRKQKIAASAVLCYEERI